MKYYIETYGCAANQADTIIMKEILGKRGYLEGSIDDSEVIIINTCGVKKPTEDKILWRVSKLKELKKPIVVTGCLPRINLNRLLRYEWNVALDSNGVHLIEKAVKLALSGKKGLTLFSERPAPKPLLINRPITPTIGAIEVQEGCSFECSFCATRFSRGKAYSYPAHDIIKALDRLVKQGAWEIWFTGQDVGAYRYGEVRLPRLLELASKVEGDFMIRVGMITPVYAAGIKEGLSQAYRKGKVFRFLHLPVQSGSDKVLSYMKRGHRISLFYRLVEFFREKVDGLTLATDIIVGHPGEEEEDFEQTVKLIERVRPDVVNLSKFGARPGTLAAKMKKIPTDVVARRSRYIYGIILRGMKERNERWIGWEGEAVVTQKGNKNGTWVARNYAYKPIVIRTDSFLLGKRVLLSVEDAASTHLYGKLLRTIERRISVVKERAGRTS